MNIDVYSDVVCPWCLIGKRQLENAIAQYGKPVTVNWRAFQLNPTLEPEGMERKDYLAMKFGRTNPAEIYARVKSVASGLGIAMNIEAITRQPNTLKCHLLIAQAAKEGGAQMQATLKEALMDAYFIQATDLTQDAELIRIALAAGLSQETVSQAMASLDAQAAIRQEDSVARESGISGVPFFIFNRTVAVSGAQGAKALLDAMKQSEAA